MLEKVPIVKKSTALSTVHSSLSFTSIVTSSPISLPIPSINCSSGHGPVVSSFPEAIKLPTTFHLPLHLGWGACSSDVNPSSVTSVDSLQTSRNSKCQRSDTSLGAIPKIKHDNNPASMNNNDLEALRSTCDYVATVMENLNSGLSGLHPEARKCVQGLNKKILSHVPLPDSEFKDYCSSRNSKKSRMRTASLIKVPSSTDGEDSDHTESDRKTGSDTSDTSSLITSHSKQTPDSSALLSMDQLLQLMKRLDNRTVPRPEKFDSASGNNFNDFLRVFEDYCSGAFRGSTMLWVGELGRLLEGDMLDAFNALRMAGDDYHDIKAKLVKWQKDSKEVRSSTIRNKFTKAEPMSGESMRLYAARLEKSFRLAYPRRSVQKSKTLRDKYLHTVPRSFHKQLSTMRNVERTIHNREMSWSTILTLASSWDSENKENCVYSLPVEQPSVWLGARPNVTDAVVQCDSVSSRPRVFYSRSQDVRHRSRSVNRYVGEPAQSRGVSSRQRSTSNFQRKDIICHHCQRPGHIKRECRRFLGSCLVCGSTDHRISECPKRRSLQDALHQASGYVATTYEPIPYNYRVNVPQSYAGVSNTSHTATAPMHSGNYSHYGAAENYHEASGASFDYNRQTENLNR